MTFLMDAMPQLLRRAVGRAQRASVLAIERAEAAGLVKPSTLSFLTHSRAFGVTMAFTMVVAGTIGVQLLLAGAALPLVACWLLLVPLGGFLATLPILLNRVGGSLEWFFKIPTLLLILSTDTSALYRPPRR